MRILGFLISLLVVFSVARAGSSGSDGSHAMLILQSGQSGQPGKSGAQTLKLSLSQMRRQLPTVEIQISDPVYTDKGQPPLKFDAFRLSDVLALLNPPGTEGSGNEAPPDEIVFQAVDGYSPSISTALFQGPKVYHEAYLAYREHGRPLSDPFRKIHQGKALLSPAPFYLVWGDGKDIGDAYPWPYQLVKIELVRFKDKYAKIYPATAGTNSPEMRGFVLFKTECIRCHSINLVGGDIGPELNIPKNVLEYWNENTLRALIKKPSDFRAKSKMPDFPQLKDSDIDDLFAYFHYEMKHRP